MFEDFLKKTNVGHIQKYILQGNPKLKIRSLEIDYYF